jgi:hypothetical protein
LSEDASNTVSANGTARFTRLRRAIGFAVPYRRVVTGIFLITLLLAGVNAAEPLILKYLFDGLASHPEKHVLVMGIGGLLGLAGSMGQDLFAVQRSAFGHRDRAQLLDGGHGEEALSR